MGHNLGRDRLHELVVSAVNLVHHMGCTGYIEYPFENELGKICLENIASDVEKEEKIV